MADPAANEAYAERIPRPRPDDVAVFDVRGNRMHRFHHQNIQSNGFGYDLYLLIRHLPYLPLMFWPLNLDRGSVLEDMTIMGLCQQLFALGMTKAYVKVAGPHLGSGSTLVLMLWVVFFLSWLLLARWSDETIILPPDLDLDLFEREEDDDETDSESLEGSEDSGLLDDERAARSRFENEAWFFLDGIFSSTSGCKKAMARIKELFGRDCVGLHARSYGLVVDLLLCFIQRNLLWYNANTYGHWRKIDAAVQDSHIKRIVFIAHSKGGLACLQQIKALLIEHDVSLLRHIEIYTFGSAAHDFSIAMGGVVPFAHVEHYANSRDYIARIGVLAGFQKFIDDQAAFAAGKAPFAPSFKPAGKLIVQASTGSLFCSHYLGKNNILDGPAAQGSQLAKYRNGGQPA